jgi:hypothetical protein
MTVLDGASDEFFAYIKPGASAVTPGLTGERRRRFCTSARRTAWLGISDSNFDVQRENSSL